MKAKAPTRFQHVIHCLGDVVVTRELSPLEAPVSRTRVANGATWIRRTPCYIAAKSVERPFGVEDQPNRRTASCRQWRPGGSLLLSGRGLWSDISEFEELAEELATPI